MLSTFLLTIRRNPNKACRLMNHCGITIWRRYNKYFIFATILGSLCPPGHGTDNQSASASTISLADADEIIAKAIRCGGQPKVESGPPAQSGKKIAVVVEDLRNGGVLGAARGVSEAAAVIGWNVKIYDLVGTVSNRDKAMVEALESKPDGLILVGGLTVEGSATKGYQAYDLTPFSKRNIPIVSWHAAPFPGPVPGTPIALNVVTDSLEVARLAAMKAIKESRGHAKAVIFTDSKIQMALTKANAIADVIRRCKECSVLALLDVGMDETATRMPSITRDLLKQYRSDNNIRWTHIFAVNDIYFDYAVPTLTRAGLPNNGLTLISAGDGSPSAFLRIAAGTFQTGTVAEPLSLHGWQLIDELNRLFARRPVSGFVASPRLVTKENIGCDGGKNRLYDPDNGYRDAYRRIWKR